MMNGLNFIICVIAVVLIIIAERGIPVKLTKVDAFLYGVLLCIFMLVSNTLK